ncbi:MAG: 1-deoxy-D-xylulose-5-phosphate reductoisomerase [bacterium]|nr:1-deoxy-D-xylulose-5-phosphate reductoisomerase [bacterium]
MTAAEKTRVTILGSTGSVGVNALKVIEAHQDQFKVVGLTAHRNIELLAEQIRRFRPKTAAVGDAAEGQQLARLLGDTPVKIGAGVEELIRCATAKEAHVVVSAIVGAAGLVPTLAAVEAGKRVALANKETLVMAGRLVMAEAKRCGAEIIPVDSEHSAIYQCLTGEKQNKVRRIILTASGGPFHGRSRKEMAHITPQEALRHPRWDMGRKITIDSATLMNKGLEVIEARWLFDLAPDQVDILVHPQSIIHSMVEFEDRSVLAQMGLPDMRTPIAYALGYPHRLDTGLSPMDLVAEGPLTFHEPDRQSFPCIDLAYEAMGADGLMPTVLNAANEVAVGAFLKKKIGFLQIPELISDTLGRFEAKDYKTVDDVLRTDLKARKTMRELIAEKCL